MSTPSSPASAPICSDNQLPLPPTLLSRKSGIRNFSYPFSLIEKTNFALRASTSPDAVRDSFATPPNTSRPSVVENAASSPLLNRFLSRSTSSNPSPAQPYSSPTSTGSQGPSPSGATLPNSDQHFKRFSPSHRPSRGQTNSNVVHQAARSAPQEVKVDGRPVSFSRDKPLENPLDWAATSSTSQNPRYDPIFLFPVKPLPKMASATSAATSSGSKSRTMSDLSRPGYDPSLSSEPRSDYTVSTREEKKRPRWVSQVKNWLVTSEPSVQAMRDQKKNTFKKHGIDPKDPKAAAKLHSPMGKVPIDAVTSTSGPTPEKALKERTRAYTRHSRGSQSVSSGFSSVPSMKSARFNNAVTPWEE
ncbi:hypothetical protein ACQKWADRAFT_326629 [Trichoderma austrokoningii]